MQKVYAMQKKEKGRNDDGTVPYFVAFELFLNIIMFCSSIFWSWTFLFVEFFIKFEIINPKNLIILFNKCEKRKIID